MNVTSADLNYGWKAENTNPIKALLHKHESCLLPLETYNANCGYELKYVARKQLNSIISDLAEHNTHFDATRCSTVETPQFAITQVSWFEIIRFGEDVELFLPIMVLPFWTGCWL